MTEPGPPRRRPATLLAGLLCAAGFVLVMLAADTGLAEGLDATGRTASSWAHGHHLGPGLHVVEVAFGQSLMIVYALALITMLLVLGENRTAAVVALTAVLTPVATSLLKAWVGRDRPPWQAADHALDTSAFPSGHASSTAALAGVLILSVVVLARSRHWHAAVVWIVSVAAGALVVLVGADRVLLGRHYPTDVIGGALLGASVVLMASAAFSTPWAYLADRRRPTARRPRAEEPPATAFERVNVASRTSGQ